jgi:uncharacterized protein YukE
MAIHCTNPNTIGTQTQDMFNVTTEQGKQLLENFSGSIASLKSHWKGSDAAANLKDLGNVYTAVADLLKSLEQIIVTVNNNEIIPLQQHIVASGGECVVGNELGQVLKSISSTVDVQVESLESWTDNAILVDAETFNGFPDKFSSFVEALDGAKNTLLGNWLEGANREDVVRTFETFNNNVPTYKEQIKKVRDNLNTIAENKKKFL